MKCADPTAMSSDARMAELAELLAAGIQRHLARQRKAIPNAQNLRNPLDVQRDVEASCVATPKVPA